MKSNINMFQPRSVQWHGDFCFVRNGKIGSYVELFDEEDLELYNKMISPQELLNFENRLIS